jgi:hypothetical protein
MMNSSAQTNSSRFKVLQAKTALSLANADKFLSGDQRSFVREVFFSSP